MKVGIVSNIGFRADSPAVEVKPQKVATSPLGVEKEDSFSADNKAKVDNFRSRLSDNNWSKTYIPKANIIHMQQIGLTDGLEYEIYPNGKVMEVGCWTKPNVILEEDEDIAKMFEENTSKTSKKAEKKSTSVGEKTANVWKFFSTANQMTKSTVKGLVYGAMTGVALLGGSWFFRALPQVFTKEGPSLWKAISHPLKYVGKAGKVMAGIGAGAVLAYQIVVGKLEANQKTAVIDHKMKVGHRDE